MYLYENNVSRLFKGFQEEGIGCYLSNWILGYLEDTREIVQHSFAKRDVELRKIHGEEVHAIQRPLYEWQGNWCISDVPVPVIEIALIVIALDGDPLPDIFVRINSDIPDKPDC